MKSKISNRAYNLICRNYWMFWDLLLKFAFYLKCKMQGVKIGRNAKLYGSVHTFVSNGGSIEIGDDCAFRSRTTSNFMGINHRCIIVATPAYKGMNAKLQIGNNCGFSGVSIWCAKEIKIGNNVRVGANTLIMDGDAHYDDPRTAAPQSIVIEDDVFIGANCVIKKGVTIGRGAMIGMNSVVTRDIPANAVAVGIPAKVIRYLNA